MKQTRLFKDTEKSFGGELFKKRKGRTARPLDTKNSMHLVLRSTQAVGARSFTKHRPLIRNLLQRITRKYGIELHRFANVGNHLHLHIKLKNRHTWRPFIRALTATIAVKIGGKSRWRPKTKRFWDLRPFTRVVIGWRAFKTLSEYIRMNDYEGYGVTKQQARTLESG